MSIPTPPNGMVSNTELILRKILGEDVTPLPPNSRVEFYLVQVEEYIERLATGATRPIGETTTALTDGATTNPIKIDGEDYTAQINDIVFYGNKEFLFTVNGWREVGDLTNLNADMIDDTNTTKKFTNATEKTKLGRVIMDSTETQNYHMQDSTPANPSDGDYWFDGSDLVASDITAMTGYAKASAASAIGTSDTLNQAMGKLEKKADDNTTSLGSKQNQVLGSWTAGTATTHSTPASTDTVLEALQKIDNNQRLDETNILSVQQTIGDINSVLEEVL